MRRWVGVALVVLVLTSTSASAQVALGGTPSDGGTATTTSLTWSHTTSSGSNRKLIVCAVGDVVGGADDVTVEYNNVAASLVAKLTTTINRFLYMFELDAPATGTNTVEVNGSSHLMTGLAIDYTGVAQSAVEASATNAGAGVSSVTGTVTTVTNNAWTVMCGYKNFNGAGFTAGAGTTERIEEGTFLNVAIFDSNGAITPAGSTSLVADLSDPPATGGVIIASLAPAVAGGAPSPKLMLLGVGGWW